MGGLTEVKFWTDGSRVTSTGNDNAIGWAAVCNYGVIVAKGRRGGSNVNAEMFAIRDLLQNLHSYRRKMLNDILSEEGKDACIEVITDSKTSLQIIEGFRKYPEEFDVNESENYAAASSIVKLEKSLEKLGLSVRYVHIHGHQDNLGNSFADYVADMESQRML